MKNIRLLTVASVLSTVIATNAIAGGKHSVGVNGSYYKMKTELRTTNRELINTEEKSAGTGGMGMSYKYSYTPKALEKFFIAPEIFYDYAELDISGNAFTTSDSSKENVELRPTYGAKLNVGYHINNKHDVYVGAGVQNFDYKITWTDSTIDYYRYKSDSELGLVVGVGYNYNVNDDLSLGLEANMSSIDMKAPARIVDQNTNQWHDAHYTTSITNVKLGLAYNF